MKKIRFILTGGTIDKTYCVSTGELYHDKSYIPNILMQSRCTIPYTIDEVLLKDSRYLNFNDRMYIRTVCDQSTEEVLIVVHGTDTMVETAHNLSNVKNKVIILVGSMIPASCVNSDAVFNIGTAVAYSQVVSNGVYISMNGILFPYDNVRKNMNKMIFENIY